MGNTCVGRSILKNGFFESVLASIRCSRLPDEELSHTNGISISRKVAEAPPTVPIKPPEQMKILKEETKHAQQHTKPTQPHHKTVVSAGFQTNSMLQTKTGDFNEFFHFRLGRVLGMGQFGTVFRCVEKASGKEYACKSIQKRNLVRQEDVEDVRREIQIMYHLAGHPNVILIEGAYENAVSVCVVMELCAGGELFDRLIERGHYTERKAAELARIIVGVVEACHSLGVMHRHLKLENFLFVNQQEESPLKAIDFGLSIFFKPGMCLKQSLFPLALFQ